MFPIHLYAGIRQQLTQSFEIRYQRKDVNITGILLARPELPVTKKEILPHLNYWHYRSDYYTEFFCIGYTTEQPEEDPNSKPVSIVGGQQWYFSSKAFSEVLSEIESKTGWRYDSECYLLITNARYNHETRQADLDLHGAMIVNIRQAIENRAVDSATQLADYMFTFAKDINEDSSDPVWEFSDDMGLRVVKRSLRDFLYSMLPKQLRRATKQAIHFVTVELQPPEHDERA